MYLKHDAHKEGVWYNISGLSMTKSCNQLKLDQRWTSYLKIYSIRSKFESIYNLNWTIHKPINHGRSASKGQLFIRQSSAAPWSPFNFVTQVYCWVDEFVLLVLTYLVLGSCSWHNLHCSGCCRSVSKSFFKGITGTFLWRGVPFGHWHTSWLINLSSIWTKLNCPLLPH